MKRYLLLFVVFVFCSASVWSQVVFEPLYRDIYPYMERISQRGVIEYNDLIKPLSRKYFAKKIIELDEKLDELTPLEKKELTFFKRDFHYEIMALQGDVKIEKKGHFLKDEGNRYRLYSYHDSLFNFNLNPILGYNYWKNSNADLSSHRWNGVYLYGDVASKIGFSFDFRDNLETGNGVDYTKEFTPDQGVVRSKGSKSKGNIEYSRIQASMGVDWAWGAFVIGKDYINWGYSQTTPLVHSSKAPTYPFLRLDLEPANWFRFNYFHGWLNSNIIDSSASYTTNKTGTNREIYRNKYYANHSIEIKPVKGLNISIGESIVYADQLQPIYLIPIMFFRAADHYLSNQNNDAGSNLQMFFGLSSRNHIPKTHVYGTLFLDEFTFSGLNDPATRRNQLGYNVGISVTDVLINNLTVGVEYARINPFAYEHYIPTTTYANHDYTLGYWTGHNADQISGNLKYRVIRGLQVEVTGSYTRKGGEGDPDDQSTLPSKPFLFGEVSTFITGGVSVRYEVTHDLFVKLYGELNKNTFEQMNGSKIKNDFSTIGMRLNYGF